MKKIIKEHKKQKLHYIFKNFKDKNVHKEHGAVIIEAAISLPIFMFLIFSILFTINMSIVQCRMQIALNETAKEISQYSYFYSLTGLNNLSAINADAAADTKQQVSDVVFGITTVYGSFENIVTDVGDAKDDISQKIEDIDLKGIENTVDTLKGQVSSEANTLSDGAQQTINTLKEAFKDPKALMLGLARIGANELDETVKSHLVAMMTQMLIKKNLADISNADDAYIDAYLRHLGVVGGFEGIYFTKSLYFKDGSDDIILIADYKVRLIRLFEHDIEFHFVQSAVTKAWMAGGLAESETTGTTLVTGEKLSDLTGDELRAKIVYTYGEDAVEKLEEEYPDDTSNWSYEDWMYFMYFSGEIETQTESETQTPLETEKETATIVNSYNPTEAATENGSKIIGTDELVVRDSKFLDVNGNIDWEKWAPNGGRVPGTIKENQTISTGTIIDRYGSQWGNYTSPVGVPYEQRALPYIKNLNAYHKYEVLKPIDNVTISEIAPAFEQVGGGIQYELPYNIKELEELGYIKEIK